MINSKELQLAYNDIYAEIRRYILSYPIVEALADLEIAVYQACPTLDIIRRNFYKFKNLVSSIAYEDDDLTRVLTAFSDLMNGSEDVYAKLVSVNEVDYEDIEKERNTVPKERYSEDSGESDIEI